MIDGLSRPKLFGIFLLAALALHLPGFVGTLFNSDEASTATMAMVINHGGRLYHQTADRKPPAVPYIYAAIFKLTGSHDLRPVRVVGAVALAATAALLAAEARRRYGNRRLELWCGLLFLLGYAAFFPDDGQAASFELFMLLPMTAAVVAAGRDKPLQAGLWLAVACLCKQTAITTVAPIALLLYQAAGWRRVAQAVSVTIGVILLTAVAFGPAQFLLWTVTGNGGYLAIHGSLLGALVRGVWMSAALIGATVGIVALGCLAAFRRRISLDLWLWLAGAAVSVVAGFRFFGHYYLQLLPPLVLIAVVVIPELSHIAQRRFALAIAAPALVMVMLGFIPTGDSASIPYRQVALRVQQATDKDDTVFVWGDLPEIYWASGRQPGTRLVNTGFLTGNTGGRANGSGTVQDGVPGAWSMLWADVAARPPDMIVDTSTAAIRQSEYYPLSSTALWPLVRKDYRLLDTVDGVRLYRLAS